MSQRRAAGTKVSHGDDEAAPVVSVERATQVGFLAVLPERARRVLLAGTVERRYAADEVLFLAGSPARKLYLVLDGRVRVLRGGAGRPHVLHVEGPGGSLGEVPLFEGTTYPATAVAAEPTRCLVLTREVVLGAVRAEPELALALLARLAGRVRHLVERLDRRAGHRTLHRLAELLLARHHAARGRSFTLAATQQEAAEEIGTVREIVVRGLRALRDRRVIRAVGGGRYVVTDEWALRQIAGGATAPDSGAPR